MARWRRAGLVRESKKRGRLGGEESARPYASRTPTGWRKADPTICVWEDHLGGERSASPCASERMGQVVGGRPSHARQGGLVRGRRPARVCASRRASRVAGGRPGRTCQRGLARWRDASPTVHVKKDRPGGKRPARPRMSRRPDGHKVMGRPCIREAGRMAADWPCGKEAGHMAMGKVT